MAIYYSILPWEIPWTENLAGYKSIESRSNSMEAHVCIWASLMAQPVNNLPTNAGDLGSIPDWGRFPGEGNGNLLQYCLGNPMDRRSWQSIVHGVPKSWTQLSD